MVKEFFKENYKKIMILPIILLIFSLVFIGVKYSKDGEVFERDVSLKGGTSFTIYTEKEINILEAEEKLSKEIGSDVFIRESMDFSSGKRLNYIIEVEETNDKIKESLEKIFNLKLVSGENYEESSFGSSLGEGFHRDMLKAIIIAFILMGIVVFIAFRTFVPSIAVILSAMLDIFGTLVVINLLDIKISIAGIAAFLLVIGYSVDTDILMTTRVLKRKEGGSTMERLVSSAKTGLTMTTTTFVALSAAYLITNSIVLKEMFSVILIALIIDVISTYGMNAGILYWYREKHEIRPED